MDDGRLLQSVRQHKDIVTCVAVSSDGGTAVSGSRDTTVVIWDVVAAERNSKGKQKGPTALPMRDTPRHVLSGHTDAVVCVALSTELDVVISGSADGVLLFHTLLNGR